MSSYLRKSFTLMLLILKLIVPEGYTFLYLNDLSDFQKKNGYTHLFIIIWDDDDIVTYRYDHDIYTTSKPNKSIASVYSLLVHKTKQHGAHAFFLRSSFSWSRTHKYESSMPKLEILHEVGLLGNWLWRHNAIWSCKINHNQCEVLLKFLIEFCSNYSN